MSHPDASARPDRRPIEAGEVWENPVTRERAVVVELPWQNGDGRGVAELTALPGARVMGEHLHPALDERFSVLQGELTVVRDGRRSVLGAARARTLSPGSGTTGGTTPRPMPWSASRSRRASALCT